jgi:hypothetical protein
MYNEQQHAGAVKSRTHESCLVAEPVVVTIEGKDIELSLADAVALHSGLGEAVKRVSEAEKALRGDGISYNLAILAKSGAGMSFPRSKLGNGEFVFVDGMPDAAMFPVATSVAGLDCISGELAQAVLENTNTKVFMKLGEHSA